MRVLLWEQEIAGSNPATPITLQRGIGEKGNPRPPARPARNPLNLGVVLAALAIATALAAPTSAGARPSWTTASASAYGPGLYGNRTACGQRLTSHTIGVAHRTLRCGTRLTICHARRCVRVRVIDRGPYIGGRVLDITEPTTRRTWHASARTWGVRTVHIRRGWPAHA